MLFLIKNFIREIKCYVKNFWCFLVVIFIMGFFLLNIHVGERIMFTLTASKMLVKLVVVIVLWGYTFWGKYPLILINPANYIYRDWHKNNMLLIINYVLKSIFVALLAGIAMKIFLRTHFEILFMQSVALNQISFLEKWKIYHEEKIQKVPLVIMVLNTILYIAGNYYLIMIFGLAGYIYMIVKLPQLNMNKYYNDLKFIYANKNTMIRGDYLGAAKIADDYNSRREYRFTLKKEHLRYPLIGKSIYIDTLRASSNRWIAKIILLLLMVIFKMIKWDLSGVEDLFSVLFFNVLCLLIVNEYFFHMEQLVENSNKGLFIPISPTKLTLYCIVMPSIFVSLVCVLYCFLSKCSALILIFIIVFNIIMNFLQYITVFVGRNKNKVIALMLNVLRFGGVFYMLTGGGITH